MLLAYKAASKEDGKESLNRPSQSSTSKFSSSGNLPSSEGQKTMPSTSGSCTQKQTQPSTQTSSIMQRNVSSQSRSNDESSNSKSRISHALSASPLKKAVVQPKTTAAGASKPTTFLYQPLNEKQGTDTETVGYVYFFHVQSNILHNSNINH